jgi:hypothetical protein
MLFKTAKLKINFYDGDKVQPVKTLQRYFFLQCIFYFLPADLVKHVEGLEGSQVTQTLTGVR